MLPAVARRSPAMTTPSANAAATIVVPCGSPAASAPDAGPRDSPAPGSSPGAAEARKSLNDEVPAPRYVAGNRPPWESGTTRILPVVRVVSGSDPTADATAAARVPAPAAVR